MGRIFAIGDIHGCSSKLEDIMEMIDIDAKNDMLVFMGDYIDRGKDPKGVVDIVLNIRKRIKKVICLLGNHEQMFLDYLSDDKFKKFFLQMEVRAPLHLMDSLKRMRVLR
jgi:Predicted phosphohydrolases